MLLCAVIGVTYRVMSLCMHLDMWHPPGHLPSPQTLRGSFAAISAAIYVLLCIIVIICVMLITRVIRPPPPADAPGELRGGAAHVYIYIYIYI